MDEDSDRALDVNGTHQEEQDGDGADTNIEHESRSGNEARPHIPEIDQNQSIENPVGENENNQQRKNFNNGEVTNYAGEHASNNNNNSDNITSDQRK